MDDKKRVQDEELEHVSGGGLSKSDEGLARCGNCWTVFEFRAAESRNVKDGCSAYFVYKCPNCGKWVESSGKVYKG